MKFVKTLVAAALLAGTGAANASIQTASNTLSEAYLSVYDSSRGLTFTLDLGLTMGDLVTNLTNVNFSKTYDLATLTATSTAGKWSDFALNLNAATTVYGVVAAGQTKFFATGPQTAPAKFGTVGLATTAIQNLTSHISTVNTASVTDNASAVAGDFAQNLSAIISDGDVANTGQHNQVNAFSTLNNGKGDAAADIAYGQKGNFYYYGGVTVPALAGLGQKNLQWDLSGNTLTYSAVPLPAAVWMFGAGLMGFLGMSRRKSQAV